MIVIVQLISMLFSLASLAFAIIFLIQLFKAKGVGHGIAGICCGLYTLIWGWQNADQLDASNPPIAGFTYAKLIRMWTGLIVVHIIVAFVGGALAASMQRSSF